MADIFIGHEPGTDYTAVTAGTSTTSKSVELRVNTGEGWRIQDIEVAVDLIMRYFKEQLNSVQTGRKAFIQTQGEADRYVDPVAGSGSGTAPIWDGM